MFTATPITGSTASTADFWTSEEDCTSDEDKENYNFIERSVALEDNSYTLTLTSEAKLTSIQTNGLYINASGVTITSVKYYPAGSDTDRFEVEGANISLNKTPFSNALTSITAQLKDQIVITSDAAYVMSADTSIPIKVTSTLPGILDLDFDAASLDPEYKYIVWHGIPGEKIPTPVAKFVGTATQVVTPPISYGNATLVAYLDDTSIIDDVDIAYTPVLTANPDGTTSVTLKDSSNNELDYDTAIYKNAIWSVTASATYDATDTSSDETVTLGDSKTFYFVVLNPHFSFGEIGSQAKLLTGCKSKDEYNKSVDDSTRPTWTGWADETEYVKLFDKLGAYYMEASNRDWPLRYSYCLDDKMYKKNYHVYYKAYKEGNRDDHTKWAVTNNESDGSSNDYISFSPVGGSDIVDAENIYSDEDDTDRLKPRYLEVRVYAKSSDVKDLAGEEILLSKSLYKIFYYLPPVITATGYVDLDMTKTGYQDSEGNDITTEKDYKAWKVTIKSAKGGVSGTTFSDAKKNGVTYYTIDSNMPRKTTNLNTYEYDVDYLKATRSTVYYAADFVTPEYWFYTPEEKEEASKSLPVVSEKCLVKIIESETYYVDDDSEEIDLTTEDKNKKRYNPYNATMVLNGMETLRLRIGNQNVVAYSDNDSKFRLAGVEWVKKEDTGFTEYIDEFEVPLIGYNYESDKTHNAVSGTIGTVKDGTITDGTVRSVVENPGDLSAWKMSSINADPITECNDRIGGTNTEKGGMFLTPISGAFFRLEPEYDGIVTLWIRQNGATETETRTTGYIRRRPLYIMDEDGVIMHRSTVMPTVDSYYCVDGSYAEISGRNTFRRDFEETWRYGILNWNNTTLDNEKNNVQKDGIKDSYKIYDKWYKDINFETKTVDGKECVNFNTTDFVHRYDKMATIIYRGDDMVTNLEEGIDEHFAKYGYELPNMAYVRYRIPVKAGKTYYVGGRLTKNGFIAARFEGMVANYDPTDYVTSKNKKMCWDTDQPSGDLADTYKDFESGYTFKNKSRDVTEIDNSYKQSYTDDGGSTVTNSDYPMYHLYSDDTTQSGNTKSDNVLNIKTLKNRVDNSKQGYYFFKYPTVDVTLYRTFTAGYWHPIVLPFSVSESRMKEIFGDEVAVLYLDPYKHAMNGNKGNYASAVNPAVGTDLVLRFTRHYYQMLYANTPAFICPGGKIKEKDSDGDEIYVDFESVTNPKFERVTFQDNRLNTSATASTVSGSFVGVKGYQISPEIELSDGSKGAYFIKGTYEEVMLGASDNADHGIYYMSNSGESTNVASVYHLSKNATVNMKPTRVWIEWVPAAASSAGVPPRLTSVGFQSYEGMELEDAPEEAGIYDIIADEVTIPGYADDTVYDMMGRVVAKGGTEGLAPGIYIYQGRKLIVKD